MNLYSCFNKPDKLPGYDKQMYIVPEAAYYHAKNSLKGPFPEGENAIATSAVYSYSYATNVLKGRFEKGEDIIATNDEYSYLYAKEVLK
ncbi:MAG: hypothetical protein ACXW2E_01945, partial [Nitrososphaeraceae archaeon]